ncbi:ribonuclease P protein component [Microvirga lotononidis]|uniref:Ribonuclease P protein component n=1 Tax=Microvirga lotononidis TaxID=864069 RepID=I4YUQ5_9HYPH|nr:ribonuclease P protein component [Microvirga lotononidis]EIM27697.1 ribonuclease P protein component [Microvirga lotononidis]WQO28165.1 ribonuclease P protein component [Microvirga lotononidis]
MREPRAEQCLGRLTKRPDFVAAASGRRFHTERMSVQARLREGSGLGLRFGLTVTKRVGHATERNRIKRRLRAALPAAGQDYANIDADVVIIGRRDILSADFALLIDDLRRALRTVTKPRSAPSAERRPPSSPPPNGERRGHSHA